MGLVQVPINLVWNWQMGPIAHDSPRSKTCRATGIPVPLGVVHQMWPCALVPSVCVPLCLVAVTLETRACTWDLWHLIVDILHAGTAQTREGWHGISLSCKQTDSLVHH